MGHVVVLAESTVQGLFALFYHLGVLALALLLQLEETRKDVLDVLEDLQVELNQVAVKIHLLDPWEDCLDELLFFLVVREVYKLEVDDDWKSLGSDSLEYFNLDVSSTVLIVTTNRWTARTFLENLSIF